jgi:lysophospholipase L1-like esterase
MSDLQHPYHKRFTLVVWAIAAIASLTWRTARAEADQPRENPKLGSKSQRQEFVAAALTPFWRAREIREPIFFIQTSGNEHPTCNLLFKPTHIVSVRSATREKTFEPEKDFTAEMSAGTISLPSGSRIPFKAQDQLYPLMTSNAPKIARQAGDRTRGIFFGEGAVYHNLQVEVTYRTEPGQWKGLMPKYAGESLPKTMAKLRNKEPISLMLCGDSISAGGNASGVVHAPPGCPAFGQLVALALEHHFGSKVTFTNHAVGGWTSTNGLQQAKEQRIGKAKPDLVIIAFGMNDVFARNATAYQANIRAIIETIRTDAPDAEFILVASMLGNAEWGMPMEQFPLYRDALKKLCGPGIVLADMTSMWDALLKRKSFYDLTGNGVNHPNDFGHMVYAQSLLALLIEPAK